VWALAAADRQGSGAEGALLGRTLAASSATAASRRCCGLAEQAAGCPRVQALAAANRKGGGAERERVAGQPNARPQASLTCLAHPWEVPPFLHTSGLQVYLLLCACLSQTHPGSVLEVLACFARLWLPPSCARPAICAAGCVQWGRLDICWCTVFGALQAHTVAEATAMPCVQPLSLHSCPPFASAEAKGAAKGQTQHPHSHALPTSWA